MLKILNHFILFTLCLHCGYASDFSSLYDQVNKITKPNSNFMLPHPQENTLPSEEQLEQYKKFFEGKEDEYAILVNLVKEQRCGGSPLFENSFKNTLLSIKQAAETIENIMTKEDFKICICLGRAPFWLAEYLRMTNPKQANKFLTLSFSGCPGIVCENNDNENYRNYISTNGLENFIKYFTDISKLTNKFYIIHSAHVF